MTTMLATRVCRPTHAPQAYVLVCPLCDLDPTACQCSGPTRDTLDRLLADTVASFSPPWLDDVTEPMAPLARQPVAAWCINASTLRPLPNVVWDRLLGAMIRGVL